MPVLYWGEVLLEDCRAALSPVYGRANAGAPVATGSNGFLRHHIHPLHGRCSALFWPEADPTRMCTAKMQAGLVDGHSTLRAAASQDATEACAEVP